MQFCIAQDVVTNNISLAKRRVQQKQDTYFAVISVLVLTYLILALILDGLDYI